jgi:sporulation protein YlmC with PRC-barrel domain
MATEVADTIPSNATILVPAHKVRGTAVFGRDGDRLGTVDELILDKGTGEVTFVILTSGGFLALGQSYHPIPWSVFRYDAKHDRYTVAVDKRLLDGAPSYRSDSTPIFDAAYGKRVTDYYRVPSSLDGTN